MARPTLLTTEQIEELLREHALWRSTDASIHPQSIVRELHAVDWMSALALVNAIAIAADTMDHHPDIFLYGWNKIRVSISTHDQGGLTLLDFALATKVDELALQSENAHKND